MDESSAHARLRVVIGSAIVVFGGVLISVATLLFFVGPWVGIGYAVVGSGIAYVGCIVVANSSRAALDAGWRRHRYVLLVIAATQLITVGTAIRLHELPPLILAAAISTGCLGVWFGTRRRPRDP